MGERHGLTLEPGSLRRRAGSGHREAAGRARARARRRDLDRVHRADRPRHGRGCGRRQGVRDGHGAGRGSSTRTSRSTTTRSRCSRSFGGTSLKIGLVTNGQRDLEEFVAHHGLEVDAMVGSRLHGNIKPHPSIFESALADAGRGAGGGGDGRRLLRGRHRGRPRARHAGDPARSRRPASGRARADRHAARAACRSRPRGCRRAGHARPLHGQTRDARPRCARRALEGAPAKATPNSVAASSRVETGPTQTSSSPKWASQSASDLRREDLGELVRELVLVGCVLPLRELGSAEELAEPREELRLERADGQMASVRCRVGAVAREPAGEHPRHRLSAEAVRDEVMRAVGHRDGDPCSLAGALALERARPGSRRPLRARPPRGRPPGRAATRARCLRVRPPSRGS